MIKNLIILTATMFIVLTAQGQNLFFIGEESYPSTETFTLKANTEGDYRNLDVVIVKDGKQGLIAVSTKSMSGVLFSGKLIIYLIDGTVITCMDRGYSEHIDNFTKSLYFLTSNEMNKLKNTDIHTIRYTLKCDTCTNIFALAEAGNWSASNKGIPTKTLIANFEKGNDNQAIKRKIKEQEAKKKELDKMMGGVNKSDLKTTGSEGNYIKAGDKGQIDGNPYANSYYGRPGSGAGGFGYGLKGRGKATYKKIKQECNEEGMVIVEIIVDREGRVIKATPGVKGTTNNDPCLLDPAKKIALSYKWRPDPKAPSKQIGFVKVDFNLGQ